MTRAQALLYMSCPVKSSQKGKVVASSVSYCSITRANIVKLEKTKLSQFLAHRSLHPLLQSRGPTLGLSSVQSISRIVGRECPSEVQIQTAVDESGIASTLDDQFPEKDPSDSDSESDGLDEDGTRLKRRRLQNEQASSKTNGPLGEGFRPVISRERPAGRVEKPPPGAVVGFKSAGSHMQELKETRLNREAERAQVAKEKQRGGLVMVEPQNRSGSLIKVAPTAVARSNKRLADQGSLLTYFGKRALEPVRKVIPPKAPTATEVIRDKSVRDRNLKEQIEALPQPKFPVRPDHHSGVMLLSSSPARASSKRRRKKEEEIPSSPPPVFSVPFSRHIEPSRAERRTVVEETTTRTSATVIHNAAGSRDTAAVANSNTMVMATMVTMAPKRRTLGVRRSMGDGWRNRASAKR